MPAWIVCMGMLVMCGLGLMIPAPGMAQVNIGIHIGTSSPPPPPIVVAAPPPLVVIPGLPVSYAPSLPYNYFFHKGRYYTLHEGVWFVGSAYHGPWTRIAVKQVPVYIRRVPGTYYKIPPAHLKHNEHQAATKPAKGHKHKKHKDD